MTHQGGDSVRLDDIWKSFSGRLALRGATLHVDPGEAVLLTGPSGAGKSTLLRLIYMADEPDRGTVHIGGRDLFKLRRSSVPYVRRNIGVVFQDFKLMAHRSVRANVAVAAEVLGLSAGEVRRRTAEALESVGLTECRDELVGALSGGLQQRVAVARALCADPPIVLCDEPTGNLDPLHARDLLELLEGIRGRGTTLLIATHDPTVVAFGMAHGWRRASLQAGQIISGGLPAHEVLSRGEAEVGLSVGLLDEMSEVAPEPVLDDRPGFELADLRESDREAISAAVNDREARNAAVNDREARSAAVNDREARNAAVNAAAMAQDPSSAMTSVGPLHEFEEGPSSAKTTVGPRYALDSEDSGRVVLRPVRRSGRLGAARSGTATGPGQGVPARPVTSEHSLDLNIEVELDYTDDQEHRA